jgi:hypothetical protein
LGYQHDLGAALAGLRAAGRAAGLSVGELAELVGMPRATLQHLLRFHQVFGREQVAGLTVPLASVIAIMATADPAQRLKLLNAAARHGWTLERVRREVRLVQPSRRETGPRRVPADLSEFWKFVEVGKALTTRFRIWTAKLSPADRQRFLEEFLHRPGRSGGMGPAERLERVREAERILADLHGVTGVLLEETRSGLVDAGP